MFKDLDKFIAALDKERELSRVTDPVDPDLEICAVTEETQRKRRRTNVVEKQRARPARRRLMLVTPFGSWELEVGR